MGRSTNFQIKETKNPKIMMPVRYLQALKSFLRERLLQNNPRLKQMRKRKSKLPRSSKRRKNLTTKKL
jgi:hypothetical protein